MQGSNSIVESSDESVVLVVAFGSGPYKMYRKLAATGIDAGSSPGIEPLWQVAILSLERGKL